MRALSLLLLAATLILAAGPGIARRARAGAPAPHMQIDAPVINESLFPGDPPGDVRYLTLTNTGGSGNPLIWALATPLPSWLSASPTSGTLAAGASQSVAVTFTFSSTSSTTLQTLATRLTFTSPNADNAPLYVPVSLSVGYHTHSWYFAQGSTASGTTTQLILANSTADTANVTVQYVFPNSQFPLTIPYSVLGNSRFTINVNQAVGPGATVAMAVNSDLPLVAERSMTFTYTGLPGVTVPGGTTLLGAPQLGTAYAFGYLDTSPNHETDLTVLNLNAVPIEAHINYYPAAGGAPTLRVHTIPARGPTTFSVNAESLGAGMFSAVVSLVAASDHRTTALGLVERSMYLLDAQTGATGATSAIGAPIDAFGDGGSTRWYFAGGLSGPRASERFILSNPFFSTAARATVTLTRPDGTNVQQSLALQAGQQAIVTSSALLGSGVSYHSATITSDQPILAERFTSLWYDGPVGSGVTSAPIPGATDVLGTVQPSDLYYFAAGSSQGQFASYLALQNPGNAAVRVTLTFLFATLAPPIIRTYTLSPTSSFTLLANSVVPGQDYALMVQATGPIVAERSTFFAVDGAQTGGASVVGYAPHTYGSSLGGIYGGVYVTTNSIFNGVLDASTGLLQSPYLTDLSPYQSPLVDPSNFGRAYQIINQISGYGCPSPCPATNYHRSQLPQVIGLGGPSPYTFSANSFPQLLTVSGSHLYMSVSTYAGSSSLYNLVAFNTSDATVAWSTTLDTSVYALPVISGGVVYVATSDTVYAVSDATGQVLWHIPVPSSSNYSSEIVGPTNGLLYFRTHNGSSQPTDTIEAVATATGTVQWSSPLPTGGSTLWLSADGVTLIADGSYGVVYALSTATGVQQWSATSSTGYGYSLLAIGTGYVFVSTYVAGSGPEKVMALDLNTGNILWQHQLPATFSVSIGCYVWGQSLIFAAETAFLTPTTIFSLAISNGVENWRVPTAETPEFGVVPGNLPVLRVGSSGVFYATTSQGQDAIFVYGIDPTQGTQLWKTEFDVPPGTFTAFGGLAISG